MLWSFYYAAEGEKLCGTSIALRKALCARLKNALTHELFIVL